MGVTELKINCGSNNENISFFGSAPKFPNNKLWPLKLYFLFYSGLEPGLPGFRAGPGNNRTKIKRNFR